MENNISWVISLLGGWEAVSNHCWEHPYAGREKLAEILPAHDHDLS